MKKKRLSVLVLLALALGARSFALTTVAITAEASEDFTSTPTFAGTVEAFQGVGPFGGFGWEVVMDRIGVGGSYVARFFQDEASSWWMDWYGDGVYVSVHPLGAGATIDPFARVGVGCAGRVSLRGGGEGGEALAISIFPVLTAGASLRFDALTLGAHVDFIPYANPLPVTVIPAYGIGRFQVGVFAGFILG